MANAHVVEIQIPIPAGQEDDENKKLICMAIEQHPLREISERPGHLLLLKLWQREERLLGVRMAGREARMESQKQQIFHLCCFFLLFHALALTLLFTAPEDGGACRRWWAAGVAVGATSAVMAVLVQARVWAYWKAAGRLQRDRDSNRALLRCVQELRMKGGSFNLNKQPIVGKRMKSSSVEIKWGPLTWCSRNLPAVSLLCSAGAVVAASRFLLCG